MSGELRLPTGPRQGPFLQAALLCEKVLLEPDGAATAVRIVDQITVQPVVVVGEPSTAPQAQVPPTTPQDVRPEVGEGGRQRAVALPAALTVTLLVIFKSGSAPGKYLLEISLVPPSGAERPLSSQEIELSAAPHGGATHVHQLNLIAGDSGDYRFDVLLNTQFVTSVPLRVEVAPSLSLTQSIPAES